MKDIILAFVVGFIVFIVGIFGFAQITGSIRCIRLRKAILTVGTITIWAGILVGVYFLVQHFFSKYIVALYIAYALSFVLTLGSGKNGVE